MALRSSEYAAQQEFWRRLESEWLLAYCNDPDRQYSLDGFVRDRTIVGNRDAADFLRAVDHSIVTIEAGGRFRMPRSSTHEVLFWEHERDVSPRRLTLWLEPIITIAAVARLHLDYGWPLQCLGMQSRDSAFDVTAFLPRDLTNEFIAGEVKPTAKQLDTLLNRLHACCQRGKHDDCLASSTRRNAHKKWLGLQRCQAPIFWALGPDGDSRVFEVSHVAGLPAELLRTDESALQFNARR